MTPPNVPDLKDIKLACAFSVCPRYYELLGRSAIVSNFVVDYYWMSRA